MQEGRARYANMITLYGRRPVEEALEDPATSIFRLHLSLNNRRKEETRRIRELAEARGVELVFHERMALSRISKNRRQDQGVALDLISPGYGALRDASREALAGQELIALDGVTNPQNLGLIIRSIAAAPRHALVLPRQGCARIDPLVYKASAGYALRASIHHSETLDEAMQQLQAFGFEVIGLSAQGEASLASVPADGAPRCFILGNESSGLSLEAAALCHRLAHIPMRDGIDSLNVAAAAALVAFRSHFQP